MHYEHSQKDVQGARNEDGGYDESRDLHEVGVGVVGTRRRPSAAGPADQLSCSEDLC
jgi:hypothetical protein